MMNSPWRLIKDQPFDGRTNMAVDEAILLTAEGSADSSVSPVLRLYSWKEPTISIGYAQDTSPFLAKGLPVVRRITGGRAVVHHMEVTYSIAAPASSVAFAGGIMGAYSAISRSIVKALNDIGVPASFKEGSGRKREGREGGRLHEACFHSTSRYEVVVGERKISGSAQRRFRKAFLQHGSILFGIDKGLNEMVFGAGAAKCMCSAEMFTDSSPSEFAERLIIRSAECFGVSFTPSALTRDEEAKKEALLKDGHQGQPATPFQDAPRPPI